MYVGGLEVKDVEEGVVVHVGRWPRRGDSRGIGGKEVCEGGGREDAGARRGKRSGEDASREGRGGGPERGHDVPDGAARRGPAFSFRVLDAEASFGRRCDFRVICLMIRTRAGRQIRSSNKDVTASFLHSIKHRIIKRLPWCT